MKKRKRAVITIKNNIKMVVPDAFDLMTPFVLREQEDWFEMEIQFIRKFLMPGMFVLDIGANYGLYTTCIAKKIGPEGKVIAFEPCKRTSKHLKESLVLNDFSNAQVCVAGVSDKSGSAFLNLNENAELNSVIYDSAADGIKESINLVSLDDIVLKHDLRSLDFIKLDAEGEESKIISGSQICLDRFSPLIMYEIKHCEDYNYPLIELFEKRDFTNYYLVPGLNILVPFYKNRPLDGYMLNLFACRDTEAEILRQRGLLCLEDPLIIGSEIECDREDYKRYWDSRVYVKGLQAVWKTGQINIDPARNDYEKLISLYIVAQSEIQDTHTRAAALFACFNSLKTLCEASPTLPRLLSLTRVALDLGERHYALRLLEVLVNLFNSESEIVINEEHLAVLKRYEQLDTDGRVGEWCLASILEAQVKYTYFSSYYDANSSAVQLIDIIDSLGFLSPELERRRQMLLLRSGKQDNPHAHNVLKSINDDNLNPDWWGRY